MFSNVSKSGRPLRHFKLHNDVIVLVASLLIALVYLFLSVVVVNRGRITRATALGGFIFLRRNASGVRAHVHGHDIQDAVAALGSVPPECGSRRHEVRGRYLISHTYCRRTEKRITYSRVPHDAPRDFEGFFERPERASQRDRGFLLARGLRHALKQLVPVSLPLVDEPVVDLRRAEVGRL